MSDDSKKSDSRSDSKGEPGKSGKREPYVSRFKKPGSGFGGSQADGGGRSGYRGPTGPVGIQRPRGANRGS